MSDKKEVTTNVREDISSVKTAAEFDQLLERFKQRNPEKYAIKMANGEFDRFRKKLIGGDVVSEEEAPIAGSPVEEPEVKRGRPRKE